MGQEKKAPAEQAFTVVTPRTAADIKFFRVRDIEKYQHYKDRNPPWVKLHGEQLEDYEFQQLPDATRFHVLALTYMASKYGNKIPNDPQWVAGRIGAHEPVNLSYLFEAGFLEAWRPRPQDSYDGGEQLPLQLDSASEAPAGTTGSTQTQAGPATSGDASKMLARCYQSASPETEAEAEAHTEADTGPASAGRLCVCCGETVFSKYSMAECLAFAKHQKRSGQLVGGRRIENPGGLARSYHRKGEADTEIDEYRRPPPPKREFTAEPCPACFGSKMETQQGRGARKCEACRDEYGKPTGRKPVEG